MARSKPNDTALAKKYGVSAEYLSWLRETRKIQLESPSVETHYVHAASSVKAQVEESAVWQHITNEMRSFNERYSIKTGSGLIAEEHVKLQTKSFTSLLQKSYRKNVLDNPSWSLRQEPRGGWVDPNNWFEKIGDIVRTTFVVRYLDGVNSWLRNWRRR